MVMAKGVLGLSPAVRFAIGYGSASLRWMSRARINAVALVLSELICFKSQTVARVDRFEIDALRKGGCT